MATGPAQRLSWRALGNGRYRHVGMVAVGKPTFVLGNMAITALGNASRRRAAEADAQPRWVTDATGHLTLTPRYLHFGHHVYRSTLAWKALKSADLVAPDLLEVGFHNDVNGQQKVSRFRTHWASLAFVLAARTAFPYHPRLINGGWLPSDFEERCAQLGRPCHPARQLLQQNVGH
ncbi:hypothetical protein SLV14_002733 [Streptomyces sp. Je 1-4]|uniref:hypothetical protein n=1 Tax=Streptomyces TaxID=1883 RepID=UPI0021DADA9F|nr:MULTISPECIES: hypothetical protein [unclassified Streptomyces]UYB40145.1 hypothetical protein SLV14_002733 [Streptomyces sp. Je 1-4]UZQ36236.1 hypothetical protein SLV14N_002733 [Streptomyces sp. Je 1-4] [Streptomyces sp. Je 1-4 4N24]UZQ43654.1 hypothetical protein SLV14NA_002733 [Streptomyces sp. Je 1-4] [Streptomyces sp. Je 1-4 4N24_ara]